MIFEALELFRTNIMDKLSFWHKVAFLANISWLITQCIRYFSILPNGGIQSTILVTGLFTAQIVNIAVTLWTGILLIRRKPTGVPSWLIATNFLLLIFQLYFIYDSIYY